MGLDQYAHARKGLIDAKTDFDEEKGDTLITSWRKHPNLQGWMEKLYREKGGKADSFNCVTVQVTKEDLDALENDVTGDTLPTTTGFFFGQSHPDDRETDLAFIKSAREQIAEGNAVFYSSWW